MEPAVLEQRLLGYDDVRRWCPECAGYPAYRVDSKNMHRMNNPLRRAVSKLFNTYRCDRVEAWVYQCIYCAGEGSWGCYVNTTAPTEGRTRGTIVLPDVNANHLYRTELHWHLTKWVMARLVCMEPMRHNKRGYREINPPPTFAAWQVGPPDAAAQLGLPGPVSGLARQPGPDLLLERPRDQDGFEDSPGRG